MIIGFEISLNYTLMPPLMLACAVATLVARGLRADSVYTEPLRQKGIRINRETSAATQQTVGDILRPPVAPLREETRFGEIASRFLTSPHNYLPVIDAHDRLVGVVALQDLKQYLGAGAELDSVIAFDVMRPPPPCLTPDQRLSDAVPVLLASDQRHVPVVNTTSERRLVGAIVRAEALESLSEDLAGEAQK
jgi:CIC family chloride channel protein